MINIFCKWYCTCLILIILFYNRYSSGEESDLDGKETKEKNKKRHTVAGNMLPPATVKLRKTPRKSETPVTQDRDSDKESEDESRPYKVLETITTKKVSRHYTKPKDYDTGSDSEVDHILSDSSFNKKSTQTSPSVDKVPVPESSSSYSSSFRSSSIVDGITKPLRHSTVSTSYSSPYSAADNLNSIRSRLGLSQNYTDSNRRNTTLPSSYLSTVKSAENGDEITSPYLSSFARRLSTLKVDRTGVVGDGESVGTNGGAYRKYYEGAYRKRGDISGDFRSAGEKNVWKNNLVSFTIVGIVIAFFVGVSFMYMGMKTEESPDVQLCSENTKYNRPTINCIKESDVGNVLNLLNILEPELKSRAVNCKCGLFDSAHMNNADIENFIITKYPEESSEQLYYNLFNLHVVLLQNRQLTGISIVDYTKQPHVELVSMTDVISKRQSGQVALEVLNPNVSWTCILYHKVYTNIWTLCAIVASALLIFVIYKLYKIYIAYRKNKSDQIYSMVEQIIDVISQENADSPGSGKSMPISHIRDMLIAPQNRDKMSSIWEASIKFLEKNESRVRFEVDKIAGEEYKTLRWVPSKGSPRTRGAGARSWQGQAFETQKGSVNNLTISPTQCLKIRHMVDKNDKNSNLKTIVQDAILEKCGPKCKILHIEIDKVSCCVYVKCASSDDAGIVYQNLHGWWYEGNLITVKYLRLERYMDHFPDSPTSGPPYLKLSSQ